MLKKSTIILKVFLLVFLATGNAWALDFNRYHNQDEIAAYLRSQAVNHPDLARFEVLGRSQQGREVALITISKNWSADTPAIYFNGTHHGNERASTEAVLALIHHLVQQQDTPRIDRLLKRYRIVLQPLVNPDGHALNIRTDSQGVDPNRDYATPTRDERTAFNMIETRLVRQVLEKEKVVASAAFHSGLEAVLWPWCHSPISSQDDPYFRSLATTVANSMKVKRSKQSFFDYQTDGEYIDYAYMRFGTYALTLEVSHEATPAPQRLAAVLKRSVEGSVSFVYAVDDILHRKAAASLASELRSSR